MNKEIKKLWIKELRSGNYKQGTKRLRNNNTFCCLGVLCNLHAKMHPEVAAKQTDPTMYIGEVAFLPLQVQRWADIHRSGEYVSSMGVARSLVCENDLNYKTFKEIAKIIDKNF